MKDIFNTILTKIKTTFNLSDKDATLVVYIAIILLVNIASMTLNFRLDLTRNNAYSLSKKSKEVVSNLGERLTVRVLFSENLPARFNTVYRYLLDLLEEYDTAGNRYFKYKLIKGDDLDEEARKFGLQKFRTREIIKDEGKEKDGYMGLVIQHAQLVEKIDKITDLEGLEFIITSRIEKMTSKVSKLLNLKNQNKHITVKVVVDGNLKDLGIGNIDKIAEKVKTAVEASNASNYDILKVEHIDPSTDPKLAKELEQHGLQGLEWKSGVTATGKNIKEGKGLFGIALELDGKYQIIDSLKIGQRIDLFRMQTVNEVTGFKGLSDSLNEGISQLLAPSKKIGYIIGHDEIKLDDKRSPEGGGLLQNVLAEVYDVKMIDLSKQEIPTDVQTIIINGPKSEFSDYELYKIDQHLMKGKSALLFLDVFDQANNMQQQQMMFRQPMVTQIKTGLDDLLKHYGITLNKDIVLDSNCHKQPMQQGGLVDYYLAPIIKRSGLNRDHVITKFLNGAIFLKASSISADKKRKELKTVSLVSSSDQSWLMKGRISFDPYTMMMQKNNNEKNMSSYDLALLAEGSLDSYFSDKEVPANPKEKDKKNTITTGSLKASSTIKKTVKNATSGIIVVGTSEITKSGFLMNSGKILTKGMGNSMQNVNLVHHMVDYLSGNISIPEMKSKSLEFNPLNKTSDELRLVLKVINIAGLPIIVILIGLMIWRNRLARKKSIMEQFTGGSNHE